MVAPPPQAALMGGQHASRKAQSSIICHGAAAAAGQVCSPPARRAGRQLVRAQPPAPARRTEVSEKRSVIYGRRHCSSMAANETIPT